MFLAAQTSAGSPWLPADIREKNTAAVILVKIM